MKPRSPLATLSPLGVLVLGLALLMGLGCDGDADPLPLDAACATDGQCLSGRCIAQLCLDPEADDDGDGLTNTVEGALGTNPKSADSDGDGVGDADEGSGDSDGDGKADATESASADADGDCIPDQRDPDDANPEDDSQVIAHLACASVGVCGAEGAKITATCEGGVLACDYGEVAGHSNEEVVCDGRDNDCDGQTDELALCEEGASLVDVWVDGGVLNVSDIVDIVWDLEVTNSAGQAVAQERFSVAQHGTFLGGGGSTNLASISASASLPCDPESNPNTVTFGLVGAYSEVVGAERLGGFNKNHTGVDVPALGELQPAPGEEMSLVFQCSPGTQVHQNFTLMLEQQHRDLFQISVQFGSGIYCHAHHSCCDDRDGDGCEPGEEIELLRDGAGERGKSYLFDFTCVSTGSAEVDAEIYMNDLVLDCADAGELRISLEDEGKPCTPGSLSECASVIESEGVDADDYLFNLSNDINAQRLPEGVRRVDWSFALGVRDAISECTLRTRATGENNRTSDDGVEGGVIAAGVVYPYVQWQVDLGSCSEREISTDDPDAPISLHFTEEGGAEMRFDRRSGARGGTSD